jgi:hypothetical protein
VEVEVEKGRVVSRVEQEGDANQRRSSCEDAEGEVYEERKNSRCHHDLIHVDALVIGANAVFRITLLPISFFFFLNTLSLSPYPYPDPSSPLGLRVPNHGGLSGMSSIKIISTPGPVVHRLQMMIG